jgi:hypothetical protein
MAVSCLEKTLLLWQRDCNVLQAAYYRQVSKHVLKQSDVVYVPSREGMEIRIMPTNYTAQT